jgi:hypothetical protein
VTCVLVGVLVGLLQGAAFNPIYVLLFRCSVHLLSGMVPSGYVLVVLGDALSSIGVGCFLLLPLILRTSESRKALLVGWLVGFCLGALVEAVLRRDGGARQRL